MTSWLDLLIDESVNWSPEWSEHQIIIGVLSRTIDWKLLIYQYNVFIEQTADDALIDSLINSLMDLWIIFFAPIELVRNIGSGLVRVDWEGAPFPCTRARYKWIPAWKHYFWTKAVLISQELSTVAYSRHVGPQTYGIEVGPCAKT